VTLSPTGGKYNHVCGKIVASTQPEIFRLSLYSSLPLLTAAVAAGNVEQHDRVLW
jgi:hypothetical protein